MRGPRIGCTPLSQDRGLKKTTVRLKRAPCEAGSSQPALPHSLTHITEPVLLTRRSLNIVKSPHQRREGKGGKMGERENGRKTLSWVNVFIKSSGTSPRQHLPCESCCSWDPRFPMTRAGLRVDAKIRGGWWGWGGVTSIPLCVFFLSSLQVPSQFDFVERSLFFRPVSIRLLPLTFLVPLGLSLVFSLHSPLHGDTTQLYHSGPPPPAPPPQPWLLIKSALTKMSQPAAKGVAYVCAHVCGKGYANGFGFERWAVLKILTAHLSACVCMSVCAYLLLKKDQCNPRLINT